MAEVLKAKRARKSKTKTNEKYLKMSRKQLENFLEQEKRTNLGGSITRFVIEPDASDEEKGQAKREKHIAKMDRDKSRRAKKQKVQRKAKAKRKENDEQEVMHIDDMLNDGSKEARRGGKKERRKARHRATAVIGKAKKKAEETGKAIKTAAEAAAKKNEEIGKKVLAAAGRAKEELQKKAVAAAKAIAQEIKEKAENEEAERRKASTVPAEAAGEEKESGAYAMGQKRLAEEIVSDAFYL